MKFFFVVFHFVWGKFLDFSSTFLLFLSQTSSSFRIPLEFRGCKLQKKRNSTRVACRVAVWRLWTTPSSIHESTPRVVDIFPTFSRLIDDDVEDRVQTAEKVRLAVMSNLPQFSQYIKFSHLSHLSSYFIFTFPLSFHFFSSRFSVQFQVFPPQKNFNPFLHCLFDSFISLGPSNFSDFPPLTILSYFFVRLVFTKAPEQLTVCASRRCLSLLANFPHTPTLLI
jgi:hypothetical protein